MGNSKNKLCICFIVGHSEQPDEVLCHLLCPAWEVRHPFVQCICTVYTATCLSLSSHLSYQGETTFTELLSQYIMMIVLFIISHWC